MTMTASGPAFDRLNYFYGQLLGAGDFLAEQRYFRDKLKLHNRCLHGYGFVCGLDIVIPPVATPPTATAVLQVTPGLALDSAGNELLVREPITIPDVLALLSAADRAALPTTGAGVSMWLTLCYQERGIEPNRPVLPDACSASPACVFGRTREEVCVRATLVQPVADTSCATCCDSVSGDGCLVLARIDGLLATATSIIAANVHGNVRRAIGGHIGTSIVGISWSHGGSYSAADAQSLLGIGAAAVGLTFQFSAPVYMGETGPQGTVDAWQFAANGQVTCVPGTLAWTPAATPAPMGTATAVTFRATATSAQLQSGDRILVTLRSAVVLDVCCRPVEGSNIGGRVPILPTGSIADTTLVQPTTCASPALPSGPTSFESWFFVR